MVNLFQTNEETSIGPNLDRLSLKPISARRGGLAKGKLADIVLLDADPVAAIGNTKRIAYVIPGERVSDRAALDRMLAETRVPQAAK